MAVNPSGLGGPKPQFELSDGTPAVGNRLFFYVAGSVNTKQNTYTDYTGGVANTNPVVLNALGMPTTTEIWFTAGQSYKVVYAPPGSDDPPNSPIFTVDYLKGINDTSVALDQWVSFSGTPTYVSATSFTLVGDQTSAFHPGRRLKSTNSGGTAYSYIVTSVFGAVTTVTVVNDSLALDAGMSAVSYGLLSTDNPSTPLLTDAYPVVSGSSDKTKKLKLEVDGFTTNTTRTVAIADRNMELGKYPTRQVLISGSGATYTTPSGCLFINVRMVGGGGGGGAVATNSGTAGNNTTFSTLTASGGGAGIVGGGAGGAGGAAAGGDINIPGGSGQGGGAATGTVNEAGGQGGDSAFGGGGSGGAVGGTGGNGATNSGGGGGGGGGSAGTNTGGGGGSGGYVEKRITAPAATYTYTVGAAANGGAAGTTAGGNGAAGIIIVDEYYN